jgi:hypothetical protein
MSEQGSSGTFQRRRATRARLNSNLAQDVASAPTTDGSPFANIVRLQATVGNRAVSRMLETPAPSAPQPATSKKTVQRLWPGFTFLPESGGTAKKRNKVLAVDQALTAFHKTDGKDYKARQAAADALIAECSSYLGRKYRATERRQGVKTLMAQATAESDLYGQLAATEGLEYGARLAALMDLNDVAAAYKAQLDNHLTSASGDIKQAVTELVLKHDKASPEVLQKVFAQEIAHLKEIAADATAPKIVREIVAESLVHIDKIHFRAVENAPEVSGPGARLPKKDEDTGGKAYVLNHQLIQPGGAAERTGSLLHELTHVTAGETFAHAPLFVIFQKGKQSTPEGRKEIKALAVDRKAKADKVEALVNASDGLRADQKALLIAKLGYGKMSKLGHYLSTFQDQLGGVDSPSYLGLKALALDPDIVQFDATLVEYDSVINQVVLYFHEWGVPQTEPAYQYALQLADEAKSYRASQGA